MMVMNIQDLWILQLDLCGIYELYSSIQLSLSIAKLI